MVEAEPRRAEPSQAKEWMLDGWIARSFRRPKPRARCDVMGNLLQQSPKKPSHAAAPNMRLMIIKAKSKLQPLFEGALKRHAPKDEAERTRLASPHHTLDCELEDG